MVDVRTSNDKLVVRARGILRSILDSLPSTTDLALVSAGKLDLEDDAAVSELIERCGGVKVAAVVVRWGCGVPEARERLDRAGGVLKPALV
jgi:N-acetylmuramic acid 6-phosphate (MurNAc-6-P) etherase